MSRIALVDHRHANARQKTLLDAAQARLGRVPSHFKVLANSTVALEAYMGLQGVSRDGSLSPQTRARIALALAQHDACDYGLSVSAVLGREVGLTGNEMASNRGGSSEDAKAAVAVKLALSLSAQRGAVSNAELFEAREAGHTEADIVEIITHVGMNLITSMVAKASGLEVEIFGADAAGG